METNLMEEVFQVRTKVVPLVTISTSDEMALEDGLVRWILGHAKERTQSKNPPPKNLVILGWDGVRGPYPRSDGGKEFLELLGDDLSQYQNTLEFLKVLEKLPPWSSVILRGLSRTTSSNGELGYVYQALLNLRETFKTDRRTLFLLGDSWDLPPDIARSFHSLEEPLPGEEDREKLIRSMHEEAGVEPPEEAKVLRMVSTTRGQALFDIEQSVMLATRKGSVDEDLLGRRWRQSINSTPSLTVEPDWVPLDDIGGLEAIKLFARQVMNGKYPYDLVLRIEEIEKAMAGIAGDSSGTSQSILGSLLTWMQEYRVSGLIAAGIGGTGKSLTSVALGSVARIPTVTFDPGALKGGIVGRTEENTRAVLRTLSGAGRRGRIFVVATCNNISVLPPEFKRRFKYGIWYYDLPTPEEQDPIWGIKMRQYNIPEQDRPPHKDWTGAEIDTCCDLADRLDISLMEAAKWIVPVARTAMEQIETLRKQATGRWLSASRPGAYRPASEEAPRATTRNLGM